jgi:Na+/H+ antiporter NhaD/arsenite permease-like protein
MSAPLITLGAVFLLIAVRQIGRLRLQIWQIMLAAAVVVLVTGSITPGVAFKSINADVMLFLFGMFVVGDALEESGYLAHISYQYFKRIKTLNGLVLAILFGTGVLSAVFMNDTVAIIGTPVVLLLARKHAIPSKPLLLALAFGVTIGSVVSPIGNPQNLLIAVQGNIENPFLLFARWLLIPGILSTFVAFALLKHFYRVDFHESELTHSQEPIRNHDLALLARISVHIILVLIGVKIVSAVLGADDFLRLTHIALAACLPILIGSPRRLQILRRIDWHTLIFFAAMFVFMESVWETGFFQEILRRENVDLGAPEMLLGASIVLSQFVSNVPLVALLLPALMKTGVGTAGLLTLAAGSTLAGNLTILGAASNVIIIQNAERRGTESITFFEFVRIGLPLTMISASIYWVFLRFI